MMMIFKICFKRHFFLSSSPFSLLSFFYLSFLSLSLLQMVWSWSGYCVCQEMLFLILLTQVTLQSEQEKKKRKKGEKYFNSLDPSIIIILWIYFSLLFTSFIFTPLSLLHYYRILPFSSFSFLLSSLLPAAADTLTTLIRSFTHSFTSSSLSPFDPHQEGTR